MTAALRMEAWSGAPASAKLPAEAWQTLNLVRFHAVSCRASARLDLWHACDTISADPEQARDSAIVALVRAMGPALSRRPVFLKPGTEARSFDEDWLLAVLAALRGGDRDSLTFLMTRRVAPEKRRAFLNVISVLTENLGTAA